MVRLRATPLWYLLILPVYIVFFLFIRKKRLRFTYDIVFIIFCTYLLTVIQITLLPMPLYYIGGRFGTFSFNVVPLCEIYDILHSGNPRHVLFELKEQIGGNIMMFVPFGFLLPALKAHTGGIRRMLAASAGFSFFIELSQLIECIAVGATIRTADIDDVITNVTGAMLGLFIFKLMILFTSKVLKKDIYRLLRPAEV